MFLSIVAMPLVVGADPGRTVPGDAATPKPGPKPGEEGGAGKPGDQNTILTNFINQTPAYEMDWTKVPKAAMLAGKNPYFKSMEQLNQVLDERGIPHNSFEMGFYRPRAVGTYLDNLATLRRTGGVMVIEEKPPTQHIYYNIFGGDARGDGK